MVVKTYMPKEGDVNRKWFIVDAKDYVLGRLASKIAYILRGKHKAIYTPHSDTGDFIVVINSEKIKHTGRKVEQKKYYHHTGYPGGIKEKSLGEMLKQHPNRAIEYAVKGMLPKNKLGRQMFSKLKVYAGTEHPHQAQQPENIEL